jgi:hypothetical protein
VDLRQPTRVQPEVFDPVDEVVGAVVEFEDAAEDWLVFFEAFVGELRLEFYFFAYVDWDDLLEEF